MTIDETIGKYCKLKRIEKGYRLTDVSTDTGYSIANISLFEHGKNRNYLILLWYISKGLTTDVLQKIHHHYSIKKSSF